METKNTTRFLALLLLMSVCITGIILFNKPLRTKAFSIVNLFFLPSGGKVTEKSIKWCIFWVPCPPCVAAVPFKYFEVGWPAPSKQYYLYGISKTFEYYDLNEGEWVVSNYVPEADDAFRQICTVNKSFLPDADGVTWYVGTSTGAGNSPMNAFQAGWPEPVFDAKDFPEFCKPTSPLGTCDPINPHP
jgi:hypothetical protein